MSYLAPLALLACTESARDTTPPDVFIFTVDTLRADHLAVYGYDRPTAPWISSLAEDAVVFDAASATSSWTVPSVGSLLTGMMPHQLRVERAPSNPGPKDPRPKLPTGAITLAERMKSAGYHTFAVTANAQITAQLGYGQGFDEYVNVGFAQADEVVAAVHEIEAAVRDAPGPVFVWVHLFDPHDPYNPPEPQHARVDEWSPLPGKYASGTMDSLVERPDLRKTGLAVDQLVALYDAEIVYTDESLAAIASALDADDDDAVVIVTADHGEEFRDHDNLGHRVNLYEETLRVPLIARWQGRWPARRVGERVSLASITPTLASLVGVPVGSGAGLAAGSVLPVLEGGERGPASPVTAELVLGDHKTQYHAIYEGEDKLIVSVDRPELTELFQLGRDRGERVDASRLDPARVLELTKKMDQFLESLPLLRAEWLVDSMDRMECEQLRSMGYVDSCASVEADPDEPPPSPPPGVP